MHITSQRYFAVIFCVMGGYGRISMRYTRYSTTYDVMKCVFPKQYRLGSFFLLLFNKMSGRGVSPALTVLLSYV